MVRDVVDEQVEQVVDQVLPPMNTLGDDGGYEEGRQAIKDVAKKAADDVISKNPSESERTVGEKNKDFQENPDSWTLESESREPSTRKGGRKTGESIEREYRNKDTGETIVIHEVTDDKGKTVDGPHPRNEKKQTN